MAIRPGSYGAGHNVGSNGNPVNKFVFLAKHSPASIVIDTAKYTVPLAMNGPPLVTLSKCMHSPSVTGMISKVVPAVTVATATADHRDDTNYQQDSKRRD